MHQTFADRLARALNVDVYTIAAAGVRSVFVEEASATVGERSGQPSVWLRFEGRGGAARFATNGYGALVPVERVPVDDLAAAGVSLADITRNVFPGGVSLLPPGSSNDTKEPWRGVAARDEFRARGEFLVVGRGDRDEVLLQLQDGRELAVGPRALLDVLRASGWREEQKIRLAVDGLVFQRRVPGRRFGRVLDDLAKVEVIATTGQIDWSAASGSTTAYRQDMDWGGFPLMDPQGRSIARWVRYTPEALRSEDRNEVRSATPPPPTPAGSGHPPVAPTTPDTPTTPATLHAQTHPADLAAQPGTAATGETPGQDHAEHAGPETPWPSPPADLWQGPDEGSGDRHRAEEAPPPARLGPPPVSCPSPYRSWVPVSPGTPRQEALA